MERKGKVPVSVILVTPIITVWNPYNVAITSPQLGFFIPKPLPTALKFKVGTTQYQKNWTLTAGGSNYPDSLTTRSTFQYQTNAGFVLKPGETKIFSPANTAPVASPTTTACRIAWSRLAGHRSR